MGKVMQVVGRRKVLRSAQGECPRAGANTDPQEK